ncbi:MAG TPA: MFS transporter [Pseudomonadales bacterium]|nr:MFS transporter [Pseudomonadales bacterium]
MSVTGREFRARWVMPFAMFVGTFAWSFVYVSLPFYIHRLSTLDEASTIRWTGWILGISPLITVVIAPISGRLAGRGDPKAFYMVVQLLQGIGFVLMALARTLPEMLGARLLLGLMGASSTFAFIMAGQRPGGDMRRDISAIQSAMTLGQVLGPPVGAMAASRVGFQESFLLGGMLLWGCCVIVGLGAPAGRGKTAAEGRPGRTSLLEVATVCLLVLAGSSQVFFLTAILPQVLPPLGIPPADTLEVGGVVIFVTGLAAAVGSLAAPRLGELVGDLRAIVWFLGASSLLLALQALAPGVWSFSALRFFQVLCIAPIFPLSVAAIAQRSSGTAIGFLNSSRIGAAFVGPVVATTLVTVAPIWTVFVTLAAFGLAVVPLLYRAFGHRAASEGSLP